jgi:D-alanyl-D-alanine carboxypeptidase
MAWGRRVHGTDRRSILPPKSVSGGPSMLKLVGRALLALLCCGLVEPTIAWGAPLVQPAQPVQPELTARLQKIVDDYLATNATTEGVTAVSASVSLGGAKAPPIDVVAGRVAKDAGALPVTPATLFPIGSITKSMTATVILQLVHEGVLSLDAPIGRFLPEYPAWGAVTLRRLLDMTSGIPSYDLTDAFLHDVAKYGIARHFTAPVLLSFADPSLPGAPAPTHGFDYSNINYIIAQTVVERATGLSLDAQIRNRLLTGHGLVDTFYSSDVYPDSVLSREVSSAMMVAPTPILAGLVGQDLKRQDQSWAAGAGAAVATPEDVTRWVRLLFQGDVLGDGERRELTRMVSMQSGAPLAEATAADRRGFGLGVGQTIVDTVRFWFYEGEPMGSRMFYGYFPAKDLVIVIAVNSAAETDNLGKAVLAAYEAVTGDTVAIPPVTPQ